MNTKQNSQKSNWIFGYSVTNYTKKFIEIPGGVYYN